jgi:hypothetical protein
MAENTLIIVVLDHLKLTQAVMEREDCLIGATAIINILLAIQDIQVRSWTTVSAL